MVIYFNTDKVLSVQMFESLSQRLDQVFQKLRKRGKLSTEDVDSALREVRLALLEADVHFSVVKDFIARVRTRAIGAEVSEALNPAQQVIKIVNEELIQTLGQPERLNLTGDKPRVVFMLSACRVQARPPPAQNLPGC